MRDGRDLLLAGHYGLALESAPPPEALARIHRFAGDQPSALRVAEDILRRGRESNDPLLEAEGCYLTAAQQKLAGRFEMAAESLRRGGELLGGGPPSIRLGSIHLERAELEILRGDRDAAEGPLRSGCAIAHQTADPRLLAWALFLHGQMAPWDDALLDFSAVLEIAEALPCPELLWQTHWEMSRHVLPDQRRGCLDRAYNILTSLAESLPEESRLQFWTLPNRQRFLDEWSCAQLEPSGAGDDMSICVFREIVRAGIPPYGTPGGF
jgi:hypothetical protein